MSEFTSARGKVPIDYVFDLFEVLEGREFSIASSSKVRQLYINQRRALLIFVLHKVDPRKLELCVAIVRYKNPYIRATRKGICTTYLAGLKPGQSSSASLQIILTERVLLGQTLNIHIRSGVATLPVDDNTPMILIGPGTGIAPVRAIVQSRMVGVSPIKSSNEHTLLLGIS